MKKVNNRRLIGDGYSYSLLARQQNLKRFPAPQETQPEVVVVNERDFKDTEATFLEHTNKTIRDYARIQLVLCLWPLVHTILLSRSDLGG